ncbi:MAG: M13 family metallopeptidase, partial [Acidobacteriota bacterium]|nr:M13 family metallopeptidase [Acidobacteriota bacterium]
MSLPSVKMALLALLASLAWAQDTPLTALPYSPSLDLSSMNRAVNPCADFYQYACGSWIKNNPIPPDQARWNVYSKLATENQRFLWGILEQAAKPSPTRTPVETEIGDYFNACMDEAARDQSGAAPLRAELDKVAALKSLNDLAAFLAHAHLTSAGSQFLFSFSSGQDFADSNRVIAFLGAGGLGLPDRDYYTKTDPKSVEIRERYLAHIQKMLELSGEPAAQA